MRARGTSSRLHPLPMRKYRNLKRSLERLDQV